MSIPGVDPTTDGRGRVKAAIGKVAMTSAGQWYLRHVSPKIDEPLMRRTRGRVNSIGVWPRFVLLTHTGAKSGIERVTPLIYFTDGDRVILVASNYGSTPSRSPTLRGSSRRRPSRLADSCRSSPTGCATRD